MHVYWPFQFSRSYYLCQIVSGESRHNSKITYSVDLIFIGMYILWHPLLKYVKKLWRKFPCLWTFKYSLNICMYLILIGNHTASVCIFICLSNASSHNFVIKRCSHNFVIVYYKSSSVGFGNSISLSLAPKRKYISSVCEKINLESFRIYIRHTNWIGRRVSLSVLKWLTFPGFAERAGVFQRLF